MSNEPTSSLTKIPVAIIGDGCAGLSLAAKAASVPEHEICRNVLQHQRSSRPYGLRRQVS